MGIVTNEEIWSINHLDHHVIRWTNSEAQKKPPVLLCHGYLDMGWSWNLVAKSLVATGHEVIAFDWRGHGDTQWIPPSSYYHFPDYIRDLKEIVTRLDPNQNGVHLVGHSMGGVACTLYTGTDSTHIKSLALVEGLGPDHSGPDQGATRLRAWFDTLSVVQARKAEPLPNLESAMKRLSIRHGEIDKSWIEFIANKATKKSGSGIDWKFDPLHRTRSPIGFDTNLFTNLANAIEIPTYYLGAKNGLRVADEQTRLQSFKNLQRHIFEDGGHMLHWTKPNELCSLLTEFWQSE